MRTFRFTLGTVATSLLLACGASNAAAPAAAPKAPTTEEEKTAYAVGLMMAQNLSTFDFTAAEMAFVQQALGDSAAGKPADVKIDEYKPKVAELAKSRGAARATKEKAKGAAFVEEAAKKAGAEKTASGLVYIPTTPGTGAAPTATDTVKVHYRGTLLDGTEFDSSHKRGQPAEFGLNQVIPCWTEGLQKMTVGGKATLVCPSDIAYGDRGNAGIPPGSTLQFEVELLDIVK